MRKKPKKIPKIKNLVKAKMLKYSAGFIYLFAIVSAIADNYIMFLVLALLAGVLGIAGMVFDIMFIGDNLRK